MPSLDKKSRGVMTVFTALAALKRIWSKEDWRLFCDNTPDGTEL